MDYREFVNAAVEEKRDEIVNVSDRIFDFAEIGFMNSRRQSSTRKSSRGRDSRWRWA